MQLPAAPQTWGGKTGHPFAPSYTCWRVNGSRHKFAFQARLAAHKLFLHWSANFVHVFFLALQHGFKIKVCHWPWNCLLCPSLLQYLSYQELHLPLQTKIALVQEKQQKKNKNPGIILSIHYRVFIGIDLVPGKIRPYKKLSLLLNYAPGQTFCESISFKGDSGDKFVSLWSKREGRIKII